MRFMENTAGQVEWDQKTKKGGFGKTKLKYRGT